MLSPIPTSRTLPRSSYQTANPTLRANPLGLIRCPNAVLSYQSYSRSHCGVLTGGRRSESSIDFAVDARCCLSSAVDEQHPPSARLLQPLTKTDLYLPRDWMQEFPIRVAYQGFPGSYSEIATARTFPNCEAIHCDVFDTVFEAVELGVVDCGIIPVENSMGGLIHHNYGLLLEKHLHIIGEVNFPIHHCLLALPGVRLENLSRVISHPAALTQCEHSLTNLIPAATHEAADDCVGAAEYIAMNQLRDTAAIASSRAAEIFGLEVLADSIGDDSSNVTRFVKLACEPLIPDTDCPFKTSVVMAHSQGAGVLFEMLSAFESRGISLTKIVTRPRRSRPIRIAGEVVADLFECLSYMDLMASMAENRMLDALAEVRKVSSFFRVLGCYPMDVTPT